MTAYLFVPQRDDRMSPIRYEQAVYELLRFKRKLLKKNIVDIYVNFYYLHHKNDPRLLKKIDKDIWEFRTNYKSRQFRLLAFWDKTKKSLVICTHGFIKKSKKLPNKELNKARRIRAKYLDK